VVERLLLDEIVEDLPGNGTESRSAPRRDKRRMQDSRKARMAISAAIAQGTTTVSGVIDASVFPCAVEPDVGAAR
jgi:hypothetical protein